MNWILQLITYLMMINTLPSINGLKILALLPHPGISHYRFFEPILNGLANVGHSVTVVGVFKNENPPPNYRDIIIGGDILTNGIDLQVSLIFKYNNLIYNFFFF